MSVGAERVPVGSETPQWVDVLHERRLEQGFEDKEVVIEPDRPISRKPKYYSFGTYDYSGEILPYRTRSDERHAGYTAGRLQELRHVYGRENVDAVPLPDGYETYEGYARRLHRLVMVNPRLVQWWVGNALSNDPRSPGEAMRRR